MILALHKHVKNESNVWMTVVTPTDRPKSVLNRCAIVVFGGVIVLSIGFRIFCWYWCFCHRSESDLLLFLSYCLVSISG